jgi:hypothetical protein
MPYISRCYVECGRTARVTNWEQDACWLLQPSAAFNWPSRDNGLAYAQRTDRCQLLAPNPSRAASFRCQQDLKERRVKFRKFVIKVAPSAIEFRVLIENGPRRVEAIFQ